MRGTQWRTLINHLIGLNVSLASYEISFARIVEEVTYIVFYLGQGNSRQKYENALEILNDSTASKCLEHYDDAMIKRIDASFLLL